MKLRVWNSAGVARDLAAGHVSEGDSFAYFVGSSVLLLVEGYVGTLIGTDIDWLLLYEFFVALVITVVGLRACYLVNGAGSGKDFLVRFICISLPVSVKLALVSWVLYVLFHLFPNPFLDPFLFVNEERAWALFSFLWVAGFTGAFYWRVWFHMRSVVQRCAKLAGS